MIPPCTTCCVKLAIKQIRLDLKVNSGNHLESPIRLEAGVRSSEIRGRRICVHEEDGQ